MTAAERKRAAAVYREAARLIESGEEEFCCYALSSAGMDYEEMKNVFFDDIANPLQSRGYWMESFDKENGEWHGIESTNRRILALCFMAAIVEAGDE